jgi:hypothetical protein
VQRGVNIALRYGDGVAVSQPFLGVSSLNFGPLATVAFFLARMASGRGLLRRDPVRGQLALKIRYHLPEGLGEVVGQGRKGWLFLHAALIHIE